MGQGKSCIPGSLQIYRKKGEFLFQTIDKRIFRDEDRVPAQENNVLLSKIKSKFLV